MQDKKRIRMVVTDLDGTLLSPDKKISTEAVKMIADLKQKGIRFTFITGRPPYAVERFAERVNITAPLIACNGALIVDLKTGQALARKSMDISPLKETLLKAEKQGHTVLVFAGDTEYTLSETAWTKKRRESGRELPRAELEKLTEQGHIYKVNIMAEKEAESFSKILPELEAYRGGYSISMYGNAGCEIVAAGVTKETGLIKLCGCCGILPEEVLAVGDNENDIQMIKAAGVGAAVHNAVETVKEAADYICHESYTDGVVEAVLKFTGLYQ